MTELNIADAVAQSTLGAELDAAEYATPGGRMGIQELKQGEVLVRQGEQRGTLFLLAEGRLNVCKVVGEREETGYQMRVGECSGTRAFIDASARQAALRADTDGSVLTLEPNRGREIQSGNENGHGIAIRRRQAWAAPSACLRAPAAVIRRAPSVHRLPHR